MYNVGVHSTLCRYKQKPPSHFKMQGVEIYSQAYPFHTLSLSLPHTAVSLSFPLSHTISLYFFLSLPLTVDCLTFLTPPHN